MSKILEKPSPLYLAIKSHDDELILSILEWVKLTPQMLNYSHEHDGITGLMLLLGKPKIEVWRNFKNAESLAIKLVELGAGVVGLNAKAYFSEDFGNKGREYNALNLAIKNNHYLFFDYLVKNKKITKKHVLDSFRINPFEYALSMRCSSKILNSLKDLGISPLDIKKTWLEINNLSQLNFLKDQGIPEFSAQEVCDIFVKTASEKNNLPERLNIVREMLSIFKNSLDKNVMKSVKSSANDVIFRLIRHTDDKTFKLFFSFFGKPFDIKGGNNDNLLLASLRHRQIGLSKYFLPHCNLQEFNDKEETATLALTNVDFFDKKQRTLIGSIFEKIDGHIDFNKVDSKGCTLLHDLFLKDLTYNKYYLFYLPISFKKPLVSLVNVKDNDGLTPLMHVCLSQKTSHAVGLINACDRVKQKIDYALCDNQGIPLLAYMFLLFRFDGDNTNRFSDAKKIFEEMFEIPEVKGIINNFDDNDVSKLFSQVINLSMGRAYSCYFFVMKDYEVFKRMSLFFEYFPNAKIETDAVIGGLATFIKDRIKNNNDVIEVEATNSPIVNFISNKRVGQNSKNILIKLICDNALNKTKVLSFVNILLKNDDITFSLEDEYLEVCRENADIWTKMQRVTFNNRFATKDSVSRLNKI